MKMFVYLFKDKNSQENADQNSVLTLIWASLISR